MDCANVFWNSKSLIFKVLRIFKFFENCENPGVSQKMERGIFIYYSSYLRRFNDCHYYNIFLKKLLNWNNFRALVVECLTFSESSYSKDYTFNVSHILIHNFINVIWSWWFLIFITITFWRFMKMLRIENIIYKFEFCL